MDSKRLWRRRLVEHGGEPDQPVPDQLADAAHPEAGSRRWLHHLRAEGVSGPGEESSWLPAPEGPFALIMRLYWPEQAALDGTWKAPVPEQVSVTLPERSC